MFLYRKIEKNYNKKKQSRLYNYERGKGVYNNNSINRDLNTYRKNCVNKIVTKKCIRNIKINHFTFEEKKNKHMKWDKLVKKYIRLDKNREKQIKMY